MERSVRPVSPAAAAAVSRLLSGAGLRQAIEYRKGIEWEGYWAEPHGDHVRVDYTPGFGVEPEDALPIIERGLERCREILVGKSYDVTRVEVNDYVYGGNPPITAPVLEIRRAGWTRR